MGWLSATCGVKSEAPTLDVTDTAVHWLPVPSGIPTNAEQHTCEERTVWLHCRAAGLCRQRQQQHPQGEGGSFHERMHTPLRSTTRQHKVSHQLVPVQEQSTVRYRVSKG